MRIFRHDLDGTIAVYKLGLDTPVVRRLIPVEDTETGRGKGFVIRGDPTETFYATRGEALLADLGQ